MSAISHPTGLDGGDFDFVRYQGNPYKNYTSGVNNRKGTSLFYLPMPAEIQDNLEASWEAQDNWLQSVKNAGASYEEAVVREFLDSGNFVGKQGIAEKITAQTLDAFGAGGVLQRVTQRTTGQIFNPTSEQFFSGMSHRTFEFTHKLVAETKEESENIRKIVNGIKRGTSTSVSNSPGKDRDISQQKLPMLWDVKFLTNNRGGVDENPYLPKISKCAITQVTTNYTGAGTWARHEDGAPVEIDLTIAMVELITPTARNFDEKDGGFSSVNTRLLRGE